MEVRSTTKVRFVSESSLFWPLGLTAKSLEEEWKAASARRTAGAACWVKEREFKWWYQQLVKLGAGLLIPGVSETYVVWDSDLVPLRRWDLFTSVCSSAVSSGNESTGGGEGDGQAQVQGEDSEDSIMVPTVAILRGAYVTPHVLGQYAKSLHELVGLKPSHPVGGGTFVTHHMQVHLSSAYAYEYYRAAAPPIYYSGDATITPARL